ncbi:hypothetical protein TNCV_4322111 [Trichonephila clavipes]|uniref:Uncharacterized protein n=1 Tax=Trichonephila clavipes TaxID=2585209 RepID=A0A8X6V935_TRICX|nr:hypothetical protein TNCV_4322111 [Trichonephila clavipes]
MKIPSHEKNLNKIHPLDCTVISEEFFAVNDDNVPIMADKDIWEWIQKITIDADSDDENTAFVPTSSKMRNIMKNNMQSGIPQTNVFSHFCTISTLMTFRITPATKSVLSVLIESENIVIPAKNSQYYLGPEKDCG